MISSIPIIKSIKALAANSIALLGFFFLPLLTSLSPFQCSAFIFFFLLSMLLLYTEKGIIASKICNFAIKIRLISDPLPIYSDVSLCTRALLPCDNKIEKILVRGMLWIMS